MLVLVLLLVESSSSSSYVDRISASSPIMVVASALSQWFCARHRPALWICHSLRVLFATLYFPRLAMPLPRSAMPFLCLSLSFLFDLLRLVRFPFVSFCFSKGQYVFLPRLLLQTRLRHYQHGWHRVSSYGKNRKSRACHHGDQHWWRHQHRDLSPPHLHHQMET